MESKAADKSCESSESCVTSSSANDADETGDGDTVQDGHELDCNVVKPDGRMDGNNADDIVGENADGEMPALCKHDSEADLDTQPLHHFTVATESECSDMLATGTAQKDQCDDAKSDSGHSSPCSPGADGDDTEKAPGISS